MNTETIINKIKKIEGISKDKEVAEALHISEQNLYQMRKREKIPYSEVIAYCKENNISVDIFFNNELEQHTSDLNYKELLLETIERLSESEIKRYYHYIEWERAK